MLLLCVQMGVEKGETQSRMTNITLLSGGRGWGVQGMEVDVGSSVDFNVL